MRFTTCALLSCLALCMAAPALAAPPDAEPAETAPVDTAAPSAGEAQAGAITEIVIEGNDRTADSVILHAADVEVGDAVTSKTLASVKERVKNLRIFETVEVNEQAVAEGKRLVIRVEERWTLIPVPVFTASGSGYGGGGFLLDTNLFGYGKTIALGGLYTTQGGQLFGYYKDFAVFNTDFTLELLASYTDEVRRRFDGADQSYAYRDTRYTFDVSPGYQLTHKLRVALGYFGDLTKTGRDGDYAAPPRGGDLHGVVTAINIDAYNFRSYYNQGLEAEFKLRGARAGFGSDRDFSQVNAEATYQTAAVADHAVTLKLQYMTVRGDAILDQFVEGGNIGTRGFESDGLWATTLATATLDYQIPFLKPSWSTWTIGAHTDFGVVDEDAESKPQGYVAPGLALRLYLKQVALPALGVNVTWSVADERPLVTLEFGGSI